MNPGKIRESVLLVAAIVLTLSGLILGLILSGGGCKSDDTTTAPPVVTPIHDDLFPLAAGRRFEYTGFLVYPNTVDSALTSTRCARRRSAATSRTCGRCPPTCAPPSPGSSRSGSCSCSPSSACRTRALWPPSTRRSCRARSPRSPRPSVPRRAPRTSPGCRIDHGDRHERPRGDAGAIRPAAGACPPRGERAVHEPAARHRARGEDDQQGGRELPA